MLKCIVHLLLCQEVYQVWWQPHLGSTPLLQRWTQGLRSYLLSWLGAKARHRKELKQLECRALNLSISCAVFPFCCWQLGSQPTCCDRTARNTSDTKRQGPMGFLFIDGHCVEGDKGLGRYTFWVSTSNHTCNIPPTHHSLTDSSGHTMKAGVAFLQQLKKVRLKSAVKPEPESNPKSFSPQVYWCLYHTLLT